MTTTTERERLIYLCDTNNGWVNEVPAEEFADYLLENGVIVLPIKVGDTVYIKGEAVKISHIHIEEEVIYCIQLDCGERDCCCCPFYEDSVSWGGEHDCKRYGYIEFTANDIGKTVFLTRQEAEKALAERGGTQ